MCTLLKLKIFWQLQIKKSRLNKPLPMHNVFKIRKATHKTLNMQTERERERDRERQTETGDREKERQRQGVRQGQGERQT